MENIFEKGVKITTNKLNCFEVIDGNSYQVVCKNLLTGDFTVFSKTEHKFEFANVKLILKNSLTEILDETDMSIKAKEHVFLQMNSRISKWL